MDGMVLRADFGAGMRLISDRPLDLHAVDRLVLYAHARRAELVADGLLVRAATAPVGGTYAVFLPDGTMTMTDAAAAAERYA